jgi:hypothetical protein
MLSRAAGRAHRRGVVHRHGDGISSGQGSAVPGLYPGASRQCSGRQPDGGRFRDARGGVSAAARARFATGVLLTQVSGCANSAFKRELLAIYSGIRFFRYMLEGRRFTVFTDHKPLTFALHKQAERWSARQQRHFSYIAEFTGDIRHAAGSTNSVAEALSRPPPSAVPCTADQGGKTNTSIATTSGGLRPSVEALPVIGGDSSTVAVATSPVPASADARSSIWPPSPRRKGPAQQHSRQSTLPPSM